MLLRPESVGTPAGSCLSRGGRRGCLYSVASHDLTVVSKSPTTDNRIVRHHPIGWQARTAPRAPQYIGRPVFCFFGLRRPLAGGCIDAKRHPRPAGIAEQENDSYRQSLAAAASYLKAFPRSCAPRMSLSDLFKSLKKLMRAESRNAEEASAELRVDIEECQPRPFERGERPPAGKITFNRDRKFDLQLDQALIDERRLAEIFEHANIRRIELKSESHQWEKTGNICIEFRQNGHPSGIAATEADLWVHELKRDGETLCYLMFPAERLKKLAREAYKKGRHRSNAGDGGRFDVVLLRLRDILK